MTSTPPQHPENETTIEMAPRGQDIEYALVLSRIIDQVKSDPAQLRWAIYEVARARLKIDSAALEEGERFRLAEALEAAIDGVEDFSAKSKNITFLPPPPMNSRPEAVEVVGAALGAAVTSGHCGATDKSSIGREATRVPRLSGHRRYRYRHLLWLAIVIPLIAVMTGLILVRWGDDQPAFFGIISNDGLARKKVSSPVADATGTEQPHAVSNAAASAAASVSASTGMPLPTVFGIYALHDGGLIELEPIAEVVPDKRVAMSTPITKPSRTTLSDGKVAFVIYRRDSAENSPDRIDIRIVARVERAVKFGTNGKPAFTPIDNNWSIRQYTYEFRVRPMPKGSGMLLVQPEEVDSSLPAGRYVLVLRDRGYDFTVAGKVTDPRHCLERTEASNGTFYSDCTKQ